jgi:hypothetical protein
MILPSALVIGMEAGSLTGLKRSLILLVLVNVEPESTIQGRGVGVSELGSLVVVVAVAVRE